MLSAVIVTLYLPLCVLGNAVNVMVPPDVSCGEVLLKVALAPDCEGATKDTDVPSGAGLPKASATVTVTCTLLAPGGVLSCSLSRRKGCDWWRSRT